mmetsp:Transcript_81931/g.231944  ORF Transcript_81931/g.231944 Transcript_81931/m.231944 type:complete len:248 (-) Transcript_81931:301-1044(-)
MLLGAPVHAARHCHALGLPSSPQRGCQVPVGGVQCSAHAPGQPAAPSHALARPCALVRPGLGLAAPGRGPGRLLGARGAAGHAGSSAALREAGPGHDAGLGSLGLAGTAPRACLRRGRPARHAGAAGVGPDADSGALLRAVASRAVVRHRPAGEPGQVCPTGRRPCAEGHAQQPMDDGGAVSAWRRRRVSVWTADAVVCGAHVLAGRRAGAGHARGRHVGRERARGARGTAGGLARQSHHGMAGARL